MEPMSNNDTYVKNWNAAVDQLRYAGVQLERKDREHLRYAGVGPSNIISIPSADIQSPEGGLLDQYPEAAEAVQSGWTARTGRKGEGILGFEACFQTMDDFTRRYNYLMTRHVIR